MDPTLLLDLVKMQMPYGKYKGYLICNIPESYLLWYKDKGFPKGKLGDLMATCAPETPYFLSITK
ncbi:MAG: hypothetical protein EOO86_18740 [Pedobacter sp.]|nr:MAG: hypothetical protein EOO86_18740 [Pedobacter sp.]